MDREKFMNQLVEYHESQGNIFNPPRLLDHDIDLYEMFEAAMKQGGFPRVNKNNKWSHIARKLGIIPPEKPLSAGDQEQIKKFYVKWIRGFEGDCVHPSVKKRLLPAGMEVTIKRKRNEHMAVNELTNSFSSNSFNSANQINTKKQLQEFPNSFKGVLPNIWRIALAIRNRHNSPQDFIFCLNCLYITSHPNRGGMLVAEYPTIFNLLTDVICELIYDLLYPSTSPLDMEFKQSLELLGNILPKPPSDEPPPSSSLLLSHPPTPPPPPSAMAINSYHHAIYLCISIISNFLHIEENRIFLSGSYPSHIKSLSKVSDPLQPPKQREVSQSFSGHANFALHSINTDTMCVDNRTDMSVRKSHKVSTPEIDLRFHTAFQEHSQVPKPSYPSQSILPNQQLGQRSDLIYASISSILTSILSILKMTKEPLSLLEERLIYFIQLGRNNANIAMEDPFDDETIDPHSREKDQLKSQSSAQLTGNQPKRRLLHPNFQPKSSVGNYLFGSSNDDLNSTPHTADDSKPFQSDLHQLSNQEIISPPKTSCENSCSSSLVNNSPFSNTLIGCSQNKGNISFQHIPSPAKSNFQQAFFIPSQSQINKNLNSSTQSSQSQKFSVQKIASLPIKGSSFKTQIIPALQFSLKGNFLQLTSPFLSTRSASSKEEEIESSIDVKLKEISDETHSRFIILTEQAIPYLEISLASINCLVFLIGMVEHTDWWLQYIGQNLRNFLYSIRSSSSCFIPNIFKNSIGFQVIQNILEMCSQILMRRSEALNPHLPLFISLCCEILDFSINSCEIQLPESLIRASLNFIHQTCEENPGKILTKEIQDHDFLQKGLYTTLCDLFVSTLIHFLYHNLKLSVQIQRKGAISDAFETLWSKPDFTRAFCRFESSDTICNTYTHSKMRKRMSSATEIISSLGAIPLNLQPGESCLLNFQTRFPSDKKESPIPLIPQEDISSTLEPKIPNRPEDIHPSYISQLISSGLLEAPTDNLKYPNMKSHSAPDYIDHYDSALGITKTFDQYQNLDQKPRYEPSSDQWRHNFYRESIYENISPQKILYDSCSKLTHVEHIQDPIIPLNDPTESRDVYFLSKGDEMEAPLAPRHLKMEVQHMAEPPTDEENIISETLLQNTRAENIEHNFCEPLKLELINLESIQSQDKNIAEMEAVKFPITGKSQNYTHLTKENQIALECLLILAADKVLIRFLQPHLPAIIEMSLLPTTAAKAFLSIIGNVKPSEIIDANNFFKSELSYTKLPKCFNSLSNEIIRIKRIQ